MRSGHRGIRVLMSDRDADGGTPEGRRFFTLDELEWPSLAKYKARLHQLGRLRSEEREMITLQTKILARSVRIAVALLMAAGSVFGALLTTTLIHPNFYFRRHVIGVVARSQECEMASLGLAPASNGPLGGLRTDLTTAFDRRSLFNELQHLWKFDTIRFNFADGPTILFYESLMARMPVSLMRVLTFGILWPEVIDIFVQPLDNCSRARLWPHAERVAAYVVDESQNREARHGQFRCRNSTGTFIFGCERRVTPYESPTATLATGLGSPWGDFAQLACSPEADSYSPAVIGLTAANAAIALLVVLWLVGRARPLIRRALVHYAQRVAPEYSYNLHEVAMASELSNPGNGHRKPGEREDGEEQQDTSEGDERILRALSAKLHGSFLDEFTPLQVIDFLLPGSTPVRCDKELPFALGSTLIHSLSGLVFHPIIYFGCCATPPPPRLPPSRTYLCTVNALRAQLPTGGGVRPTHDARARSLRDRTMRRARSHVACPCRPCVAFAFHHVLLTPPPPPRALLLHSSAPRIPPTPPRRPQTDLYGCHQGVRQFPEETTQICGAESGSLNIWALVFALVAAFQGVAWTAWVCSQRPNLGPLLLPLPGCPCMSPPRRLVSPCAVHRVLCQRAARDAPSLPYPRIRHMDARRPNWLHLRARRRALAPLHAASFPGEIDLTTLPHRLHRRLRRRDRPRSSWCVEGLV